LLDVPKDLSNQYLFDDLKTLKHLYFNETNPTKKQEYKKQIDELISRITNGRKDFDFEVYFYEVVHDRGGFDVVIGNPPYVRADHPEIAKLREAIKTSNLYETLWEKWDLYTAFIERGFKILRPKGILEFIVPDAYMSSKYAEKSHEYFLKNAVVNRIDFCSDLKIFTAEVRNIIIEFQKEVRPDHVPLRIRHTEEWGKTVVLPSKSQSEMAENTFKLDSENKTVGDLSNTLRWGEICYVSVGLVLQADEKRFQGEFVKDDLISDTRDEVHCKPYIEAKWTSKYVIEKVKYLEWGTERVPSKIRRPTFPELYIPEKIVKGRMTDAVYDDSGLLCNDSCFVSVLWKDLNGVQNRSIDMSIKKDFSVTSASPIRSQLEQNSEAFSLKYLLAVLNSKFAYKFLDSVRRSQLCFYPDDLKKLPIKRLSRLDQQPFVDFVDKILALTRSPDYLQNPDKQAQVKEYETQIDHLVYHLYSLTEEDIKIIEHNARVIR
jgi:adenine-specific DNA-methyltransferase